MTISHLMKPPIFRHIKPVLLSTLTAAIAVYCVMLPPAARGVSSTVVISQVYGGGGNTGAIFNADFIELFNRGNTPVSLNDWSVQYTSTTGTTWQKTDLPNVTLQPGQYFLIKESGGVNGAGISNPDVIGTIPMSATAGKVALLNVNTLLTSGTNCPTGPAVVDIVGCPCRLRWPPISKNTRGCR